MAAVPKREDACYASDEKLKFTLQTFDEIVGVLGGVKETARITGRTPAQVCQWRSRYNGQFPPSFT